jgi:hypothetical protein
MLKDIDNEFDEIDSLLRDIDTLKIEERPKDEPFEERISNSSFEHPSRLSSWPKTKIKDTIAPSD